MGLDQIISQDGSMPGGIGKRKHSTRPKDPGANPYKRQKTMPVREYVTMRPDIDGILVRKLVGYQGSPRVLSAGVDPVTAIPNNYILCDKASLVQFIADCKTLVYVGRQQFAWIPPKTPTEIICKPAKYISLFAIDEEPSNRDNALIAPGVYAGPSIIASRWYSPPDSDGMKPVSLTIRGIFAGLPGTSTFILQGSYFWQPSSIFSLFAAPVFLDTVGVVAPPNSAHFFTPVTIAGLGNWVMPEGGIPYRVRVYASIAPTDTYTVEDFTMHWGPGRCDSLTKRWGRMPGTPATYEIYTDGRQPRLANTL
jgi:hypothetical protein